MNNKLLPIGTVVYTFRDAPFTTLKGKIIGYGPNLSLRYKCEFLDTVVDGPFTEHTCHPYLTEQEAIIAHTTICDILFGRA